MLLCRPVGDGWQQRPLPASHQFSAPPPFAILFFRRVQQLIGRAVVVDNRQPQRLVIFRVTAKSGNSVVPGPLADQVAVELSSAGVTHAQVVACVPLIAADTFPC